MLRTALFVLVAGSLGAVVQGVLQTQLAAQRGPKTEASLHANLEAQAQNLANKVTIASRDDITAQESKVANETGSPALAAMVSSMYQNMRELETPRFREYADQRTHQLRAEEAQLRAKLAAEKATAAGADEDDDKEAADDKDEDEEAPALPPVAATKEPESKGGEESESKGEEESESERGEESESEEGGGEVAHEGSLFAMTMLGTVSLLLIVVGMSLSRDKTVRIYTIAAIDNIVAVFMAVLVFQAIDDSITEMIPLKHHQTMAHGVHALLVLLAIYIISFQLRKHAASLAIFCACAAHYGSFASMGFATTLLAHHWADSVTHVLMGFGVIVALNFVIFFVMEMVRSKMSDDDEWRERIDDVANDFGAMAAAVTWSLLVRTLIAGEFHHIKTDPETEGMHSADQRRNMLIYGCCIVPFAAVVVSALSVIKDRLPESSYWKKRTIMFATSFCSMSVAWAFLLWGQWQFASYSEERSEIFCKTAFALVASFATVVGIVLLAKLSRGQAVSKFRPVRNVLLASLSLLVGWGWEQAFDSAVETIAEDSANPAQEKIIIAIGLCSIVVPVYALYLKPFAMECEEAIEKGEDDDEPARA